MAIHGNHFAKLVQRLGRILQAPRLYSETISRVCRAAAVALVAATPTRGRNRPGGLTPRCVESLLCQNLRRHVPEYFGFFGNPRQDFRQSLRLHWQTARAKPAPGAA